MATNLLEELGEKYKPTKRLHNYLKHYWTHFKDIRADVRKVLEIGVADGRSLALWRDFFPQAQIYGLDINPDCARYDGDRIKVFIGDQSDRDFLAGLDAAVGGGLDIIIDDGSHDPLHQLFTFSFFIKRMAEEAVYVVEDIGVGRGHNRSWVNGALAQLVGNINYWDYDLRSEDWNYMTEFPEHASWLDRNISGVAFYRFLTFVMKSANPGNPYLRSKSLLPESG